MSKKSFLQYFKESKKSKKPNKIELFDLIQNKTEFLSIAKKYLEEPTLEDKLDYYKIKNYTIREDGETIDVKGDVNLSEKKLTNIPFKFGKVTGTFSCSYNQITTLEGAPSSVGKSFYCTHNQLKTLEGGPKTVGGIFYCHMNNLTTLEGAPSSVGSVFSCYNNAIKFTREDVEKVCNVKGNIYV